MPITTDLSRAPYFDDYNEKDNYHRILFKPSVAVQVRELNQLQTILQNQIERFGDNVYKRGTIIDGCNFVFSPSLKYVKINDLQTDGAPVNVSTFKGLFAKNANNVVAQIVETSSGFEATAPNLNTLHLKYVSTGTATNTAFSFNSGQTLTIYNPSLIVSEADVVVKSTGFSNNDNLIILSAIEISNTLGGDVFVNSTGQACTFTVGEVITQDVTGAQAQIMEVNSTANVESLILKIRPLASNLRTANSASWLFAEKYEFNSSQSQISGLVQTNIGKDAFGTIITDSTGGIKNIALLNGGTGYYVEPWITVSYATPNTSPSANGIIDALRISCKTFLCNVTVNDSATAIGAGVGLGVSDGIIYQKGHFIRVSDQFIVVDKYNEQTNNVVGFDTVEEVINFRVDQNLLDNATGSLNEKAPGADRLKLTPKLVSLAKEIADANTIFLPLIEYNLGKPAKQRKTTQFNSIAKEMAQRTFEQSGNYVLDQFLISTEDVDDAAGSYIAYRVKADPGTAYIDGYRVQTYAPTYVDASKASSSETESTSVAISYGNYIKIKEVAGFLNFATGDKISLRDTAKTYLTSSASSQGSSQFPVIVAAGNEIGTAKIRSMQIDDGAHGSPDAVYRLYLFDIKMNRGKNFKNARSIFYDGTGDINGVGDIILDASGDASIINAKNSTLLFRTGLQALNSVNSISYTYRTTNNNLNLGTNGIVSVSVAQFPGEYFPYTSLLTNLERRSITLVPLANTQASTNASGGVIVQSSGYANVIGVGTDFRAAFKVGDYIKVANSGGDFEIKRINKIANATHLTVNQSFSNTLGSANAVLFFPRYVPIPLAVNQRTANVQSNTTLTVNIGNTLSTAVSACLSYDVRKTTQSVPKKIVRNAYVKIYPGNNAGGTTGPWSLGHPDILRLRNVYEGRTTTFNGNSTIVISADDFISFTNDYLADGQLVVYATATGNAAISGLTNNQSYYVTGANSTGVKLASSSGGSALNITATGSNTTQYLMSVSNTESSKITQNFYIDHNQRRDYYDIGYLYKQQNYSIPPYKLLLVQFDALTVNENGLKTVSSYPTNDVLPLLLNTNSMHTIEIPELMHDNGDYYDLRDSLDFRPYSSNTAILSLTVNDCALNPAEIDPDNRFSVTLDKKFPLPDSVCDVTCNRYLPRIDSIVLYGNNKITIVNGTPSKNPQPPKLTQGGLLLNHLIVPPYPSFPKKLSSTTLDYLNKNVLNVVGLKKRQKDYTVSVPITPEGLPAIQSKPYTMQDIASLERRIADLEYYTSLSFTEDRVTSLDLPSSVDSTTNRFKFGFFVDNFTTSNFAEVNDPAYYAQIFGYELNPKKKQFKIEYSFNTNDAQTAASLRGKKVLLPSTEVKLIKQPQATEATTIAIATTETTFTTTGTEITNTTTKVSEITTTEWALKTQEQQFQQVVTQAQRVQKSITKQRTVVKVVPDADGVIIEQTSESGQIIVPSFTASRLSGRVNGRGTKGSGASNPILQRNDGDGWYDLQAVPASNSSEFFIDYSWAATGTPAILPSSPKFRVVRNGRGTVSVTNIVYSKSKEETSVENFEETITVTEDVSRYEPTTRTLFSVNPTTNTTRKEEILVDSIVQERTTSVTKSLFNPRPSALMQMDQLFNLPGALNSPTIDLLSFIQDDINS